MVIIGIMYRRLYEVASDLISPFTGPFVRTFGLPKVLADMIVVALLVKLCFLIGTLVATSVGSWLWQKVEEVLMARVPGYRSIREVTAQLLENSSDSPFRRG